MQRPENAELRLSVCPHDTDHNLFGWMRFSLYLGRQLGCPLHFDPHEDFEGERLAVERGAIPILYTSPYNALLFQLGQGYLPIAKIGDSYDQAVLIRRKDASIANPVLTVATAPQRTIIYHLGQALLGQTGIGRGRCQPHFVNSASRGALMVSRGEVDLAVVYEDAWEAMIPAIREDLEVVAASRQRQAFHCFMVHPELAGRAEELQMILTTMGEDPQGKEVLKDLRCAGMAAIESDAFAAAELLVE